MARVKTQDYERAINTSSCLRNSRNLSTIGDTFDHLNKFQRNILIKGELIRTYDALPNTEKTKIMRKLELSKFASKWYKLEPEDKKKLLNYVIN